MKFSVIMASTLAEYGGAASRRDEKIVRAIDSVIAQTFTDWELIVVADGCMKTMAIVARYDDPRIKAVRIDKRPWWDGAPRNKGIELAAGEYIIYIDNDDYWGDGHLQGIADEIGDLDWAYFNDWVYNGTDFIPRNCDIKRLGANGTSNVCHRKSLGVLWGHRGYAHDHYFNQKLLRFRNYKKVNAGEYCVCHIPGGAGYDL